MKMTEDQRMKLSEILQAPIIQDSVDSEIYPSDADSISWRISEAVEIVRQFNPEQASKLSLLEKEFTTKTPLKEMAKSRERLRKRLQWILNNC
jgi:hypothetical protein